MIDEQVRGVMRSALLSISKKKKIDLKNLRIQMKLNEELDNAVCFALNKTQLEEEISWAAILGVKAIAFKRSIVGNILNRLHELAEQNDIDKNLINVRIYATDMNGTPKMHLYSGTKAFKLIDINELI